MVFSYIFGFPAVNCAPKGTKIVNFQCVPFEPNFKVLKDFSNNGFVLLDYLWPKFQQDQEIFGGIRNQKGMTPDAESIPETLTIFSFTTTYAILMKLTTDIYLNEPKNQFFDPILTIS